MANGHVGRTFWDFLAEGGKPRVFVTVVCILALILALCLVVILLLGFHIEYRDRIAIERTHVPTLSYPYRVSCSESNAFTVPCDGFIYVFAQDDAEARYEVRSSDSEINTVITTSSLGSTQSGMFPVTKGMNVYAHPGRVKNAGLVHVLFFPLASH